jgi:Fic family protein
MTKLFNQDDIRKIQIDTLTDEAINTSLIEGEVFKRESVRSSFRKKLDKDFDALRDKYSTKATDNLVEILIACSLNKNCLTIDRLHDWHNCLFENNYSKLDKINVASFRKDDEMEVISGVSGFEKVHYKAIPVSKIPEDIKNFLDYCNKSSENIYIKCAIAQLWFVSIHPYDDGNGRISRAITDYILSKYSLNIEHLIQETKFWDIHRNQPLNEREIKVLNKIFDIGIDTFEGGLNTKKYMAITKVSKATATRDIAELIEFECIKQIVGTAGRNVRYTINI